MKTLKLEFKLGRNHEKHSIYLGGQDWLKHQNKTFLKKYLRTYKKVLTDNVRILNNHNAQIYHLFRTFYFELSNLEVAKFTETMIDFNRNFNWIFSNIGGDQNPIIFFKIDLCIQNSIEALMLLKQHAQKHKNYPLRNQAHSYLKMVKDFEKSFEQDKRSLNLDLGYRDRTLKIVEHSKKDIA